MWLDAESDLVGRLRTAAENNRHQADRGTDTTGRGLTSAQIVGKRAVADMHDQSADEIERLRHALRRIADGVEVVHEHGHTEVVPVQDAEAIAREALKE